MPSLLGARPARLIRSALARPVPLLLGGSALGLAAGLFARRMLAYLVYQATPRDPIVLAAALFSMILVGIFVTAIPAARALRVNPAQLLREE